MLFGSYDIVNCQAVLGCCIWPTIKTHFMYGHYTGASGLSYRWLHPICRCNVRIIFIPLRQRFKQWKTCSTNSKSAAPLNIYIPQYIMDFPASNIREVKRETDGVYHWCTTHLQHNTQYTVSEHNCYNQTLTKTHLLPSVTWKSVRLTNASQYVLAPVLLASTIDCCNVQKPTYLKFHISNGKEYCTSVFSFSLHPIKPIYVVRIVLWSLYHNIYIYIYNF